MQEARYKAFISYSHRDDKWAAWLHRRLEAYQPPKNLVGQTTRTGQVPARLAPVFRDREELPSATDLGAVISEALAASACQIVICSPNAARSKWVNEEILAFKRLGREDRIFCLIVGGEPNATDLPGRAEDECFPPALRFKLDPSGALSDQRTEPIAADARENKDGRENAKLKLIAGMLGVGFDALRQREIHRRQRRLMAIAAASLAGMVVTTGLAVLAVLARSEAEAQRARAEAEAETARQTTNFLVELFEVSDPSAALGNTITAREILDRGARRIDYELRDRPAIQATLMDTMGTVYKSLGLYSEARSLLERGLRTRRSLYGDRHADVAASAARLGEVLGLQAEIEEAVRVYEGAIETLRALPDADPGVLAQSLFGLSEIRRLQGEFASAEMLLREVIALQRPQPDVQSLDLARSLDQLGLTLVSLARYDDAESFLREALSMRRSLLPGGVHPDIDDSLNDLGIFLYEAARYEEAEPLFRESLDMNLKLLGDAHPDVAIALNNLAFVLHDTGQYEAAEEFYQRALEIRIDVLGENHPLTALSRNNLAYLYHDRGDVDRAIELARQAVADFRAAYPGDHPELAYSLQNLATYLLERGDYAAAETLLTEALAMNQRLRPADHPDIGITQSGMALLLLETQRPEAALQAAMAADRSLTTAFGAAHWRTAWARALSGGALLALGRFVEAESLLLPAHDSLNQSAGPSALQLDTVARFLAELYTTTGRPAAAADYQRSRGPRAPL